MSKIIYGPYSLYKRQITKDGFNESVVSICVMQDNSLSERQYQDQQLMNTTVTKSASLENTIQNAF